MIKGVLIKLVVFIAIVSIIIPLIIIAIWSIASSCPWPYLLPQNFSLRGIEEFFGGYSGAVNSMLTSVLIGIGTAFCAVSISIPAARAIKLYDFYGKNIVDFLLLLPVIVPVTSFAMGIHVFFIRAKLNDTIIGVIIAHTIVSLPYTVKIMSEVVSAIGNKYEVQAYVLGAGKMKALFKITIPLLMPGLVSAFSMAFIISMGQYFLTFLIGGGTVVTLPIRMFPYIQSGDRQIASMYGLMFILITLVVLLISDRFVRKYYSFSTTYFFS
ncbi:MAG TPA: ABC transporter permease subunit [Clostridiaceae bacterium]|nr:ABC transporter permease subunit [Clostridiaceae bacterium]